MTAVELYNISVGIAEAARLVGISPSSMKRMLDAGTLPSFRLGGRRLVMVRDLEARLVQLAAVAPPVVRRRGRPPKGLVRS